MIDNLFFSRTDDLKYGDLIGVDKFGNKYFQNNAYFVGKKFDFRPVSIFDKD